TGSVFIVAVVWGISFKPIQEFLLLFNVRMFAVMLVLIGSVFTARWLHNAVGPPDFADTVRSMLFAGQILLLLLLFTGEIRDLFEKQMYLAGQQDSISAMGD